MRSRPLPVCLFALAASAATAGYAPAAAAHSGGSSVGAAAQAAWPVDAWIIASGVLACWLALAWSAAGSTGPKAVLLGLAALMLGVAAGAAQDLDAIVLASLLPASWLYAAGVRRLWSSAHRGAGISHWHAACYCAGLAVLIVALLSPLDAAGEELFSMHMAQHELLMLAAAPLLVCARPLTAFIWAFPAGWRQRIGRAIRVRPVRWTWTALTRPFTAWAQHAAILWIWHAPALFQASLADEAVHILQHFCFLASALLFWAALIGPSSRLRQGGAALYVLTTMIHTGMLGALLTFSPRPWYPLYAGRTGQWGLTLLEDQQLGGLIMWVPAGLVLLCAGLALSAKAIRAESGPARNALLQPGPRA